jgi:TrkA domain protein
MSKPFEPITEQDLPGIGRRYQLQDANGQTVTVILHHSGRRDLYLARPTSGETDVASFTDDQARRLGALLAGVYFKPAAVAQVEAVIGGLLIDWVTLHDHSPGVGRTIAELEVRRRTRMTVAAIVRGDAAMVAPEPSTTLEAGDRLIVIGRPEDLGAFVSTVVT